VSTSHSDVKKAFWMPLALAAVIEQALRDSREAW